MNKFIYFIFFIFLFFSRYYTQTKKQDSLLVVYNNKTQADTTRLKAIHDIAWSYIANIPDSAIILAEQQLQLAKRTKQKKHEGLAFRTISASFTNKGNYSKALQYGLKSLKINEEINDKQGIGNCYINIGNVYYYRSDYPKALKYYLTALKILEEVQDKASIGICYRNIGNVYHNQSDYPKALKYAYKALKSFEDIGDKQRIGSCYSNIGNVYQYQSDYSKALLYDFEALRISEEMDDKRGIGTCYINLGVVYYNQSDYPKALVYGLKALKILKKTGDKQGTGNCYLNMSALYNKLLDPKLAIKYGDSTLQISKEIKDIEGERMAYQNIATAYAKLGKYKEAYGNYVQFKSLTDSIFNTDNSKQLSDLRTNFEVGQKEKEIEIQTLKISEQELLLNRNRLFFIIFIIGSLLLASIAWAAFSRYKIKQQALLKTEMLNQQELRINTVIDTQEQERKRIARDLHDGMGQTLASIKINFSAISNKIVMASNEDKKIILQTIKSIDDAYKDVCTLSYQMMPKALQEEGLTFAIADLLKKTLANSTLSYKFNQDYSVRFDEQAELGLYRIFQELFNNVLKHANASQIEIHLHKINKQIVLIVEDNGSGIEQNKNRQKKGIGLSNIEARVHALKGSFSISAGAYQGTVASVRIPVI